MTFPRKSNPLPIELVQWYDASDFPYDDERPLDRDSRGWPVVCVGMLYQETRHTIRLTPELWLPYQGCDAKPRVICEIPKRMVHRRFRIKP
jgi:hypothetical protein